jgi:hypothetical protein
MLTTRSSILPAEANHLADAGSLRRLGGVPYLHTLIAAVPTTANAPHYARIVAEHARRRKVADLGSRLTHLAGSNADTRDVLAAGNCSATRRRRPGRRRFRSPGGSFRGPFRSRHCQAGWPTW